MLGSEVVAALSATADVVAADLGDFDVTDAGAVRDALRASAPDAVINCAAWTDVDGAETHRAQAFAVNASGAGNVARAAAETGARLLHVSTDYVFDGSKDGPYEEGDDPRPLNAYGESKLAGEREVAAAGGRALVARTAWLYGHGGRNFVDTVLSRARRGEPLRIVSDQVGPPTSARDLAVILAELLPTKATGIVHATNSGSCSWYELGRRALDFAGLSGVEVRAVPSSEFPRPAARPANSVLRLDRLVALTGWLPRPWDEALMDHIRKG
jgi:dTDP-4-dehydrorhamnose reductase